jgi:hypothetical protein
VVGILNAVVFIMDPASAIGIAAASVAFLDFSLKTMSVCRELRDSTTGALPENLDIERRAKTLQRITKDLNTYVTVRLQSCKTILAISEIRKSPCCRRLLGKLLTGGLFVGQLPHPQQPINES